MHLREYLMQRASARAQVGCDVATWSALLFEGSQSGRCLECAARCILLMVTAARTQAMVVKQCLDNVFATGLWHTLLWDPACQRPWTRPPVQISLTH